MSRHAFRATALVAAMVLVLSACSSAASPSPSSPPSQAPSAAPTATPTPEPTPVPVTEESLQLDFVLSGAYTPILWGKDKGYFEEVGIDLDVVPGRGTDLALAEINGGRVNFAIVDMTNYIVQRAAAETETTAVYVYNNIATTGIASLEPLDGPEDMVGKTFGTVAQSSGRLNVPLTLHQNGVDWDPETQIQLMDFSVLYPTLFSGAIDTAEVGIVGSWEGAYQRGQEQGVTLYLSLLSDWGFKDYSKLVIVRNELIESDPDRVKAFVEALYKSEHDALENATGDDMFNLLKAVDPQADEAIVKAVWDSFQKYVKDPGPLDEDVVQYKLDYLRDNQDLVTDLTPEDLYTNEFIPS
jgi:NitT/TauT family transport system substrate-binding protein